ncbi:MAG: calcium/sodium antiporter, partial [Gammaproteobacteria bacterium]|nr:calcium/sodium antiporter [Gammaproteobacteria bacterium]
MLLNFALIFIGIALLVWSADRFTDGASAVARNFGVSPLIVGLTIVAMGSSAPEIFVSVTASLGGSPGLAIGNAIGSNIANIALV